MLLGTIGRVARVSALVVSLAVLGGACSKSDGSDGAKKDSDAKETTTTAPTTTVEPVPDEEFTARVDEFASGVTAAGTDFCSIIDAGRAPLEGAPSNPAQVEQAIRIQAQVLDALAASTPVDPKNAPILQTASAELIAAGTADGFSTDFLAAGSAEILTDPEFVTALKTYETRSATECGVSGAPDESTTIPAG